MEGQLNPEQREAVSYESGPLLVLAGAGSGKTRVIAYRIAYLVRQRGVLPHEILAITFTRKAAAEMRRRIEELVSSGVLGMWIGTFHSVCARILREHATKLGYRGNFSIYDEDDQRSLVKNVIEELDVSDRQFPPGRVLEKISSLKAELVGHDEMARLSMSYYDKIVARIYDAYQKALVENNAMDFDDLLVNTVRLFSEFHDVRSRYSQRFKHVLVDEYQDTNRAQYRIIAELRHENRNLCVVGDDDQSIYGWRGADIRNILEFEESFPEAKVIRMEQNYRSTGLILEAANSVIKYNVGRKGKTLRTDNEYGDKILLLLFQNEEEEAEAVAHEIFAEQLTNRTPPSEMAVLYRTNAQSRALEIALRHAGISYQLVGATSFYERKEIKDILAYLRLCANPRDEMSLRRILNVPPRRVGQGAVSKLAEAGLKRGISFAETLRIGQEVEGMPAAALAGIKGFLSVIDEFTARRNESVEILIQDLIERIGYRRYLESTSTNLEDRLENLEELVASARQFAEENVSREGVGAVHHAGSSREGEGVAPRGDEGGAANEAILPEVASQEGRDESPLAAFLNDIALVSQIDTWHPEEEKVTLMTAHNAKGLEFSCVFITGLEDGLFPHSASMESNEEIEEERRLFYVALTRAKRRAILTAAARRRRFDSRGETALSRFVHEIPDTLITTKELREVRGGSSLVGKKVFHEEFGRGVVTAQDGQGDKAKLTVHFGGNVVKRIMARYLQLERDV
jgi:DNA helicase-2/ATP-dependent DNA helicase PcrA